MSAQEAAQGRARELNFDGLVGPTHNYGGLSVGNLASIQNEGRVSNPRAAALQGLSKMRFMLGLGVGQAVLPPLSRPDLATLRRLGFDGSDEEVLARVQREDEHLLRLCASASSMWAANAATVAPSADTHDARVHLLPANLSTMFHRAIEAPQTTRALRAIFSDATRFVVHDPLPGVAQFADEGAANHTRLWGSTGPAVHLFAWGRSAFTPGLEPRVHPARQTLEASRAASRLFGLYRAHCLFAQQHPDGIDAGAFHTDVLGVGHGNVLLVHELCFANLDEVRRQLYALMGSELHVVIATRDELPVEHAVRAYPFNSQLVTLPSGEMAIIAPEDSLHDRPSRAFLERVVEESNPVAHVHYLDVRESMDNGGGPACLRLRVALTAEEERALGARVVCDAQTLDALDAWVSKHYRDRLTAKDLGCPRLQREVMTALDELTGLLELGSIYDFQR
jgi:succinylarginine dihydrolase